jgi:hypothetical protein
MYLQTDCSAVLRIHRKQRNHLKNQIEREVSVSCKLCYIYIS